MNYVIITVEHFGDVVLNNRFRNALAARLQTGRIRKEALVRAQKLELEREMAEELARAIELCEKNKIQIEAVRFILARENRSERGKIKRMVHFLETSGMIDPTLKKLLHCRR